MKLRDIIELAYYKVDEDFESREASIDKIFTSSINAGYGLLSINIDKKTKDTTLTHTKKITLPSDFHSLVALEHNTYGRLSEVDYELVGDILIPKLADITTGTYTLTYVYVPSIATTSEDVDVTLKDMYCISLAAYAAYQYALSQNKIQMAQMLLNEFSMITGIGKKGSVEDNES